MQRLLSRREKTIIVFTLSVIILAVSYNFLITPVLTKFNFLNKELNYTRTKLRKYLWLLSQKEYIQSRRAKFSSTFKDTGRQQDTLVNILSEIENLAKNSNIKIIDLRPQTSEGASTYKEIFIDLRTEGNMEGYLNFIYNLENSLSLLRIKRFQLTAKPRTSLLEGTFSISKISTLE